MGIPGLINAIGAGERISLSKLAITHLERTARPIRIAVDISIWLFQVQAGRGGQNPELRTLFYRLLKFLALPIHPLFVYDGREKPPFKRGKAVSGHGYANAPIIRLSQTLIDLFKFPRHEAPGEAEAECARLQNAGVVDAVMSNDVDALMFGSSLAVMNFSKESGSGNSAATHVTRYEMQSEAGPSKVGLDRAGMILFAMLSGGDYLPSGVPKCGSKLAAEIAKAGFGQDLLEAFESESDAAELDMRLREWRDRLQYELEENESGYFQTKHKAVRIPDTFPDRKILSYYAKPIVSTASEVESLQRRLVGAWDKEIDALEIRKFTARVFDWNYRSGARKVVRLLAEPLVSHRLRLGRRPSAFPLGISLSDDMPMLQKVYKSRTSFSTDGLSELQLDMVPIDVVGLDLMAEEPNPPLPPTPLTSQETVDLGEEDDDAELPVDPVPQSPTKKRVTKRYDPYCIEKVWIFETIANIGIPDVVRRWRKELADKAPAVKKATNRKTGPKKKGPIDPGMKHGSLLRYGTLTKEKSEISQSKHALLFEGPASTPPKSSPSVSHSFEESSDSRANFSGHTNVQYMAIVDRQAPSFDELDDFASFSGTSKHRVKHHTITNQHHIRARAAVGDISIETLETSIGELSLEHPSPQISRKITMSYSNAGFDQGIDTKHISNSPPAKGRRGRTAKAPSYEFEDPPEVRELEDSMKLLSLQYPEIFGECLELNACDSDPAVPVAKSSPKRAKESKLKINSPKSASQGSFCLDEGLHCPTISTEETLATPGKRAKESRKPRTIKRAEQDDTKEKQHTLGAAEQGHQASVRDTESSTTQPEASIAENISKNRNTKEKRARSISVVDLT